MVIFFSRFMNTELFCDRFAILRDVPLQLWEAQTADGSTAPPLLTRFYHNKVLFYGTNFLRCYLSYFSPDFILHIFGLLGTIFFLIGIIYIVDKKKKFYEVLLIISPFFPLFRIPRDKHLSEILLLIPLFLTSMFGIFYFLKFIAKVFGRYKAIKRIILK